jgi:hypothetical protein
MRKLVVFALLCLPFSVFAENDPKSPAKDEASVKTVFTGKVSNMGTYKPLSDVTVEVASTDKDFKKVVNTDANGRFVFEELPQGNYQVTIRRRGYETVSRVQSVSEGQKLNLGFMLLQN